MKEIIIAILGSSALTAVLSAVLSGLQRQRGTSCGVQQLLYDRIKHLCKGHLERGFIPLEELEDLERMHKIYHDELRGNGFLAALMQRVRQLPSEVRE